MNKYLGLGAVAAFALFGTTGMAFADECTGHDHDTGTAVGAVGGAAIGGLASHSIGGALIGGVVGGLAGNAIDRSQDCSHQQARADDRAYDAGRQQQAYDDSRGADYDRQRAYDAGRADQSNSDADRIARPNPDAYPPAN